MYKLVEGEYRQQLGEPFWMPEVGLGIGRGMQPVGGIELEVLLWHDAQGHAYPVPEAELSRLRSQLQKLQQRAEVMQQRAEADRQRAEADRQRAEAAEQQRLRLAEYV